MSSNAKTAFDAHKLDIDRLWAIHQEVAGAGKGRKYDVEVINRSAIVFITACWESYVEDLAIESFDIMVANAPNALSIPSKVQSFVSKKILEDKNITKMWSIADSGWRSVLTSYKPDVIDRWIGNFNTPKCAQIDNLYEELLGIKNISNTWYWQKMSNATAKTNLDKFISIRGNIAHRTIHNANVYKSWGVSYLRLIEGLIDCMETELSKNLKAITLINPW